MIESMEMDICDSVVSYMAEEEVHRIHTLHNYIRYNLISQARSMIANLSEKDRRKLTRPIRELNMMPAVLVAIFQGLPHFVEFLVNECKAETEELVASGPYEAFCPQSNLLPRLMSPLEIAVVFMRLDIVEFLSSIASDRIKNRALHVACLTISLETAKLLLGHGADVNTSDDRGVTCLMAAISNANFCRFLLSRGADFRPYNFSGETALHIATRKQYHKSVAMLLQRGADPFWKNVKGEDAFRIACNGYSVDCMNILIDKVSDNIVKQIELYQLLGAMHLHANDDITSALSAWRNAVLLSAITQALENKLPDHAAKLTIPFGIAVEATSLLELEELRLNDDAVFIQALLLTHKHLGATHPNFFGAIETITSKYFEAGSYDRWLHQLIYWFQMIQNPELHRKTSAIQGIFWEIECCISYILDMTIRPSINFDLVYEFTRNVIEEAIKCTRIEESDIYMKLILRMIFLVIWMNCNNQQMLHFQQLLRIVIKSGFKSALGRTILMNAVKPFNDSSFRDFFPRLGVVTKLLECGAEVNDRDDDGNNVVHYLVEEIDENYEVDMENLRTIATLFVEAGIHLDSRNHRGWVTALCLEDLRVEISPSISLMCLAARTIRLHNLPFVGLIPDCLIEFVEMH